MAENIQPGVVAKLKSGTAEPASSILQVLDLEPLANDKYKVRLTDGKDVMPGVLASQVGRLVGSGKLAQHSIIKVENGTANMMEDGMRLLILGVEVLGAHEGPVGGAQAAAKKEEAPVVKEEPMPDAAPAEPPAAKTPGLQKQSGGGDSAAAGAAAAGEAKTPAAALKKEGSGGAPGPSPYASTPAMHPTPPSAGWAAGGGLAGRARAAQPIASLNPYNNNWVIKVKVVSKGQKRSFTKGAVTQSVFSVELVDDQGTTIEGTFWREAADRFYDAVEEGKVYLVSGGQVKPANKKFSSVRNDYTLQFDNRVAVEECADEIDTSKMTARMEFVPIDQLAAYADKKMTVDVIGVVASAAPLGSVKRKTDNMELSRRDITIVDQSLKTVVVTLWGSTAEGTGAELEALAADNPIVAISACRVSSYNGVSVSGLQRSQVLINPQLPEADELRSWWESTGRGAATTHVGEGMESAIKRTSGGAQQRSDLQAVREAAPTTADEKPTYATVTATFAQIDPKQQLWYLACPENNRKVVEAEGGGYFCEYDGKTYPSMTRRYILQARIADESGEMYVQVFNDQAEILLNSKADDLAAVKEGGEAGEHRFQALMRGRTWQDYVVRVRAQAQEYNGEQRVRYAVADLRPLDFAAESRRLLAAIRG